MIAKARLIATGELLAAVCLFFTVVWCCLGSATAREATGLGHVRLQD